MAAENYKVRKELKAWYLQKKDWAGVARVCEEMIDVSPFGANIKGQNKRPPDMELHRDFATALLALGKQEEALRERRVQVELARLLPEEERASEALIGDRLALGNMLLEMGQASEALAEAVAILRLSPNHVAALMLKKQALEAGGDR